MKTAIIITISTLLFLSSSNVLAKIYKCTINGKLIYQSDPCPVIKSKNNNSSTFGFDGWEFGTNIHSMKQVARDRQLAMTPGTATYIARYNEKVLNRDPKQRVYTYKTKIMDKLTTVSLLFTKTTQELYQVKVVFHVALIKHEERKYFYESLYAQLSDKYGKAKNIRKESAKKNSNILTRNFADSLLGTLQAWGLGTKNVVTLGYQKNYHTMSSYELTYKYIPLVNQNTKEITYDLKLRTNEAILKDSNKL